QAPSRLRFISVALAADRRRHARLALASAHQVIAGAEGAPVPADDDHLDVVVRLELLQRHLEVPEQVGTERVQRLGSVQRDPADLVTGTVAVDEDGRLGLGVGFGHGDLRDGSSFALLWTLRSGRGSGSDYRR